MYTLVNCYIPVGPTQTNIATRAISDAFHYSKCSYQSNHVIPSSSCSISVRRDVISASNLPQMERARRPRSPRSNFLSALFRANLICSVCYVPHATPSTAAPFALHSVFARMQQRKHKSAGDVLRVVVGCRWPNSKWTQNEGNGCNAASGAGTDRKDLRPLISGLSRTQTTLRIQLVIVTVTFRPCNVTA